MSAIASLEKIHESLRSPGGGHIARLHRLHQNGACATLLRAALHFRGERADVAHGNPAIRIHLQYRGGQPGDRELASVSVAIDPHEMTALHRLAPHRSYGHVHEAYCTLACDLAPILLGDYDEVVAPDVPHEVVRTSHLLHRAPNRLPHVADDHVCRGEAKGISKGLEIVEVEVTHREPLPQMRPPRNLVLDGLAARETAGRIAVPFAADYPQQRHDPRAQLTRIERLGEIVVRTGFERFDLVCHVVTRREHEHGNAGGEWIPLDRATDFDARHPRHDEVEHEKIRLSLLNGRERGKSVGSELDLMPRRAEHFPQHEPHVLVIVDTQDVTHD